MGFGTEHAPPDPGLDVGPLGEFLRDVYGPQQVVAFHDAPGGEEREQHARRAYELVDRFLALIDE